MSDLIDRLKKEHRILVEALDSMTGLGVTSKDGQAKLYSAKEALLAHLNLEDKELYPVLRKAAESDDAVRRTLDVFAKDMEEISKTALSFFAKYSEGGESLEFAKELGRLVGALKNRIGREEDVLYAQYEKLA
ncbi:MAG: hemerythrin domain-containing protein [bacterium]|nr:hemerythrin domain-containing protein [bacterium]